MSLLVGNEAAQIIHSSWRGFGLGSGCPDSVAEDAGRLRGPVPFWDAELRRDLFLEERRSLLATFCFAGVWATESDGLSLGGAVRCDDLLLEGLARRCSFSAI